MQKWLYVIIFLLPASLHAQEVLKEADSLINKPLAVADSVAASVSSAKGINAQLQDSLARLTAPGSEYLQQTLDSLRQLSSGLDTLRLRQTLDSLQQLQLPSQRAQAKVDSIRSLLDVSANANQQIEELNQQLSQPLRAEQQKLQKGVDKVTSLEGVNHEALSNLREQTGVTANTDLPEIKGLSVGDVKGPALPGVDVPAVDASGIELPGVELPKVEMPSFDMSSLKLPESGGLENVQESFGKAGEITDKAGEYTKELDQFSMDGKVVDDLAEEQLVKSKAGAELQKQLGEQAGAGELQKLGERDLVKNTLKEQTYEPATDHFKGHKDKLTAAREKLSKYKGRYQEVKSVKDLPKNPLKRNPLKGKPLQEKLVFGSIWQFMRDDQFMMDLGPSISYRITDKLEIGAAYQWRLTVDKEADLFLATRNQLNGYSLFADFKFKKGFFIRGTAARLNILPLQLNPKDEILPRKWINGYRLGAGKSYTFYKSIKGYSLLQYNFTNGIGKPYKNMLQMKIGFYINGGSIFSAGEGK